MTSGFLMEDLSLGRLGSSEKVSWYICCFQGPTAQNSQYAKVAYFGLVYSAALKTNASSLRMTISDSHRKYV